jgi:hypothetical protein
MGKDLAWPSTGRVPAGVVPPPSPLEASVLLYQRIRVKRTVPQDFRLLVFFLESVSPKPLSIPGAP